MYKRKRQAIVVCIDVAMVMVTLALVLTILPRSNFNHKWSTLFSWVSATALSLALILVFNKLRKILIGILRNKTVSRGENALITEFINKLRFCYSTDDFYEIIGSVLEEKGDCSVLFVDRRNNYVMYNSPDRLTCSKSVMLTLQMNFSSSWDDGCYFIGENLGLVLSPKNARGFFFTYQRQHFYVFCRYAKLFDPLLYESFYEEFCRFAGRTQIIGDLSEISALSSEWQQLADTQKFFLPHSMPKIAHMNVAAYYRPLVNVSGDYYSVLPITESKTLLMLGDVSGKGLAAALVMGLVINTVKIIEDKEDLPKVIQAVDKAIKGMKLQDKYTVLFLGVVDTEKMTIRYVNASMSDPLIISKAPEGYKLKPLSSNCSLVGIIDLPEIEVSEQKLFRGDVILMASDGVSEVMDENGVELGDTMLYEDTIKRSAKGHPQEFINDVVNLVMSYNGDKKLRDDVTMMVAKIEG